MSTSNHAEARKRKRIKAEASTSSAPPPPQWKTDAERKRYSTKLLDALRRVRPADAPAPRGRAVRLAADRALAVAAKGRTRWSRAIIAGRPVKLKPVRRRPAMMPSSSRSQTVTATGSSSARRKPTPVLEKKAMVLGRLVPGCRKLSFPTLLEEASDYIAALQMQVRAMSELTLALSAAGAGGGGGGGGGGAAAEPPGGEETM